MKICILGLDCAAPEIVFADERLANIRRLTELGLYGRTTTSSRPSQVGAFVLEIPDSMQGRSLVAGMEKRCPLLDGGSDDDKIIFDRLAGLGYV